MLGLIRTARWFVGTSTEFGPTLYFVSQFDSSLEKYFDDFVLNGKTNLEKIRAHASAVRPAPRDGARHRAVRCARADQDHGLLRRSPEPKLGPDPKDGRLVPEDEEFERAVYGDGNLEDKVNAFFQELAKPYEFVRSGAAIDTDLANEPQFTNVPQRLGVKKAA